MITAIIFWFVGLIVGAFTLVQISICLFFALPTAWKMTREGFLVSPNPLTRRYLISIVVLLVIFGFISVLVYFFGPGNAIGAYIGGIVISLLIGIGKVGANKTNTSEFLETNKAYLSPGNTGHI